MYLASVNLLTNDYIWMFQEYVLSIAFVCSRGKENLVSGHERDLYKFQSDLGIVGVSRGEG